MRVLDFEKASLEKVKKWQWLQIKKLLERAQKTKFYSRLFKKFKVDIKRIKNFKDFAQLPETNEEDLRENPYDFLFYPREKIWRIFTTSGTTGKPKIIFREPIEKGKEVLSVWYHLFKRINWWPKIVGIFRPARGLGASGPVAEKMMELLKIPYFSLPLEAGEKSAKDAILNLKPDTLITSPSFAILVLKELKKEKIFIKSLGIKKIITTGESLFDEQRKDLEKEFGAEVINVYGAADPSVWLASECSAHCGLHIFPYTSYIEKVKDGLLVTPFANRAMVLIRYKLKDIVEFDFSKCTCKRTLPRIIKISRSKPESERIH
jgi:phenylacetate-CoA ligase